MFTQPASSADEIVDIRREVRIGKFAFARAETSEIEPQDREPLFDETTADTTRRKEILRAREAVREQRERQRWPDREIKACRQLVAT